MSVAGPAIMAALMLGSGPAFAAEPAPLPAGGLVAVLPTSPVVADGSQVELHVVAIGPDGAPLDLAKVKASASKGSVGNLRALGPGLYSVRYTPPSGGAGDATVSLKGKSASKLSVDVSAELALVAPPAATLTGTTNPTELVLNNADGATVSFTGAEGGSPAVRASAGELQNLVAMGGGKHTARFVPPKVNFPHLGILTATSDGGAGPGFGYVVLPLNGNVDYPVQASPNATVLLQIRDKEFGPVQATPQGTATVPVVVPPGVTEATLVSVVDGQSTQEAIDLRVPETRMIALFPQPASLPTGLDVPVRAVALKPEGEIDTGASLVFKVDKGEIGEPHHVGSGVYEATWSVGDTIGAAKLTVEVDGSSVQVDQLDVELVAGLPSSVSVVADPSVVTPDVKRVAVTATVEGPGEVDLIGENAARDGDVKGKGGTFEATFTVSADDMPQVHTLLSRDGTEGPVAGLVLVPARENLPADGESTTRVDVVAVDAFGLPVADTEIALSVVDGGGSVPGKVSTGDNGIATVTYTVGEASGVAHLRATAGGATADVGLLLVPPGVGPADLPRSGSAAAQEDRWEGLLPSLWLSGEVGSGPALAAYEVGPAGESIVRFDVVAVPDAIPPGGEVRVVASALSADEKLVPKASLDALTSGGELSDVSESEPGRYEVTLTAPDEEGTVKVSLLAGGTMGLIEIPVDKDAVAVVAGSPWGATGDGVAEAAPDEAAEKPEKPPKEPKEKKPKDDDGEFPWLRVRASGVGSLYAYEQTPGEAPGQLLPSSVTVTGGDRAFPVGYELDGRAWQPGLPYLGYHARFRQTRYSISIASGQANDWLYQVEADVLGRIPIALGSNQLWFGGKVGVHYNDFMIFTGCLEQGCSIDYGPIGIPGLGLGLEVGTEIGPVYGIVGFKQGLAQFAFPYSTGLDVNVGYQITDNVFVDLGMGTMSRRVVLRGEDSGSDRGELNDGLLFFEAGVGFSL